MKFTHTLSRRPRIKYKADRIAWDITRKAIEKEIQKASKIEVTVDQPAGIAEDQSLEEIIDPVEKPADLGVEPAAQLTPSYVDRLKEQLTQHLAQEPHRPRNLKLMYNNASPAAILRSLHENWPSASLSSDEAGGIFNGQALADLAMINKLWEGGNIHVERIDSESFILRDARLSLALMVQPKIFRKYLERRGDEARAIGLFARCFISCPISSLGARFIGHGPAVWQHLPIFLARTTELLTQNLLEFEAPEFTRPTLQFSPDAKQLWINAFNEVESYLYPGQYLSDISDYGAKFGENLARLAALFHFFGGETGEISYETTNRALAICKWFLSEFKRLFASASLLPVEVSDANELENWMISLCIRSPGGTEMRKNFIAQMGPNKLRISKARREAALYVLANNYKVFIYQRGKTKWVALNPFFFPIPPVQFPPVSYPVQFQ